MHRTRSQNTPGSTWTSALALRSARHPKRVLGAWLVALALSALAVGGLLGDALTGDDDFTGTPESSRAAATLEAAFPPDPGAFDADEAVIVRASGQTIDDGAFRRRVEALSAELTALGGGGIVEDVVHYYESGDAALVGRDRGATAILVDLEGPVEPVAELVAGQATGGGFATYLIGDDSIDADFEQAAAEDLQKGEIFGLGIALVILLGVFGTVVASLIPIAMAVAAIVVALGCVAVIGQAFQLSFFVVNLLVMMGLAVGIDYSLFVVSRVREERREGRTTLEAIAIAGATASRAVVFSGITVVLALIGMFLVPQTLFRSLATGAIIVVLISVLAALTLLPAVLGLLGSRVDALPLLRRHHRAGAPAPTVADRVTGAVLRRPRASLAAGILAMLVLAAPYLAMNTGSAGVGTLPESFATKQAHSMLQAHFPGQGTADAEIAVTGAVRSPSVRSAVGELQTALERDADFGRPELTVARDGQHARISARVAGDALDPRAVAAVRRLRDQHIPQAFGGVPATAQVAGSTASEIDFFDIAERYQPIVVGTVLVLSFLLLVVAFRSLVVPAVAIGMNLLSVGAAYGLLVLVFQEGVGAGLFGFQASDTVEAWLPLFLFTVLFGLSMDYQVFLLSRIRERYDQTRDTRDAVGFGLRSTARLITGAALIMVAVFAGFAGGQLVMFQQMGFGLGIAVLLDATLVRCVLVPATMLELGRANWYLPARLHWVSRLGPEAA